MPNPPSLTSYDSIVSARDQNNFLKMSYHGTCRHAFFQNLRTSFPFDSKALCLQDSAKGAVTSTTALFRPQHLAVNVSKNKQQKHSLSCGLGLNLFATIIGSTRSIFLAIYFNLHSISLLRMTTQRYRKYTGVYKIY